MSEFPALLVFLIEAGAEVVDGFFEVVSLASSFRLKLFDLPVPLSEVALQSL